MTMSRCEKEPIVPDHIDEQVHMTMLWCEKKIWLDHIIWINRFIWLHQNV